MFHAQHDVMKFFFCDYGDRFHYNEDRLERISKIIIGIHGEGQINIPDIINEAPLKFTNALSTNIFYPKQSTKERKHADNLSSKKLLFASLTINLYDLKEAGEDNIPFEKDGKKSDSWTFKNFVETNFGNSDLLQIEDKFVKKYDRYFGNENGKEDIYLEEKNEFLLGNYVSQDDATNFMKRIKQKLNEDNYSAVIIYISAHGSFGKDGKQILFSDGKIENEICYNYCKSLKDLLASGQMDDKANRFKSIPKIILNDNCYGDCRNYAEAQSSQTESLEIYSPPEAGGMGGSRSNNRENYQEERKLWNSIIFNASSEQSSSYDRTMLDVFERLFEYSEINHSTDIMELSCNIIKMFKEKDTIYSWTKLTKEEVEKGRQKGLSYEQLFDYPSMFHPNQNFYWRLNLSPCMCEIEVNLSENFILKGVESEHQSKKCPEEKD